MAAVVSTRWSGTGNTIWGIGRHQNPAVGAYSGNYAQELGVSNIEAVDLAAGVSGLHLSFTAQDVAVLTSGSDFNRASLGLGLTGTGSTLFVNGGSNDIDLSGWTELGAATVNGGDYQIYQSGSAYLGALFNRTLAGTSAGETLSGYGGNDTISGGGGADTLLGRGGDDLITQTAAQANGAAGSVLNGGVGDDRLIFAGSQAYTASYVSMLGGDGNDVIEAGLSYGQYVGSVKIEGGAGNDLIAVGHIEGSTGGLGYIDGGDGNDVIQVRDTWNGVGIWGNSRFQLRGGAGDDRFELAGTQVNVLGNDRGAQLNGGSGFDTLVWNGRYNLGIGRHQNPAVGLYAGQYAQELGVSNIEAVELAAGVSGLHLSFTAQDVATLTSGSDFNRASLGLGLTGTGSTLFVNGGSNDIDLSGWTELGAATVNGGDYDIYQSGSFYLGVSFVDVVLAGTSAGETLSGYGGNDTISGGGGADTLLGSGGDDLITQTAAQVERCCGIGTERRRGRRPACFRRQPGLHGELRFDIRRRRQ